MRASTSSRPPRSPSSRPAEPARRSPARLLAAALPRRLSTLPLLLAALAILAFAALVSTAPSADAHHDGDGAVAGNVVFETTLTVASFTGTRKGCSDYDADADDKCSNQLAANSFTYKGSTYQIRYIAVDNAGIPDRETRIVFYQDMPAASTPWTLEIAGETYNWSDGTSVQSNKGRKWSAGASALQDGAQVTVRIIETPAVFETTLTVASFTGTRKGCSDYDADADDKCSNQLAANSFTYKGSTYRFRYIAVDNAGIPDRETRIVFYQDMPAASTPWTLEIAGETYNWSDGTSVQSNKGRKWSAGASALQDGAQVTVRIVDTTAFFGTTLTASSSIPGLRGGCSDYDADADDKCSNQLAANSFAYRGSSYTFRHIAVDDANIPGGGPEVRIIFYEDMPPASTPWAFEIAGRTYRWNDGASVQSGKGRTWPTGGLTLQDGAEVPVRMIHTPVIWSATLTPQTIQTGLLGCDGAVAGKKCSQTAVLTDDDFTYGASYEVYKLYTYSGKLFLQLNKDIPAALKAALTLKVGSASYPFADGTLKAGTFGSNSAIEWTAGPSLTSGSPVAVAMEAARSTNANLSGLTAKSATSATATFSVLALSPSTFSAATTAYTASVAQNVTHVKLTPTKAHTGAVINVGKGTSLSAVTSGSESPAIALAEGANAIRVEVTAEDGTTKRTYTVTVTILDDDATALVSNIGELGTGVAQTTIGVEAVGFTTGSHTAGYSLSSIEADLNELNITASQRATIRAELWSAATGGGPDSKLADLTVPSTIPTTGDPGLVAFAAPADTTLTADTTYYFVIYTVGNLSVRVGMTCDDDEDSGGAAGWSIENHGYYLSADAPGASNTWASHADIGCGVGIRVRGEAATPTTPTVSLSAAPDPVTEGSPVTITATLSAALSSAVSIPVTLTAVTAESGDIGALTSISIASGQTSGTGTITTAQDTDNEDETFTVSLGTLPSSVSAGTPNSVTVTIADDDPTAVTLSAASDTVSEGVRGPNNEAGLVIVTATLDVGYTTAHTCAVTPGSGSTAKVRPEGSSTSDWDWRLYAAGVRFNAGATSATFNVAVQDDSAEESAETAIIDIDCTGGVTDSLTLTIEDNDGTPAATLWSATLNVADKTTTEAGCDNGKSGAECSTESVLTDDDFIVGSTTWSVTALLSQKVTGALSMKFDRDVRTALDDYSVCIGARALPFSNAAHSGGSAWAEWDGAAADQHWFAGRDPVLVRISGDCSVSYDADLSGLTAKQQTSETAVTGTSLALSPAFSGATTAYTASVANNVTNVRLTPTVNDPDATVRVGPATDLYPVRSGETSRTLAVRNNGANSFKVVVTAPDGATMKTYTVTVFRAGSGNVPKVSLSALAEVNEGSPLTVEALLSGPLAGDVTIPLTLTPGTAEPGDYGTLASITIPAGQTSASGVIATTRDADTDDETFTVSLAASLPSSVTAGAQPSVRVTIRDLDGAAGTATPPEVTLSVVGNPVREGGSISVFVILSKPMAGSVTIPITLTPGTAEPGDYGTLASVTVSGVASHPSIGFDGKPFAIAGITTSQDDDLDDETFTVSLGTLPSSVTPGGQTSVTVVINDNDKGPGLPTVSLWASPNPVSEGETVTITARLPYNWLWSDSVTVPVLLSAGTAESGDYGALTPASITILPGQSSGTATVATAEDADYDDETFTVSLGPLPSTLGPANTRTSVEVTIADDDDDPDAPRAYIVAVPADVLEGGTVKVQVLLTKQPGRDVTLPITVTHVTSEPGDFVPLNPASITIPANKASGEVTLQINWDDDGDDETFTVSLGRLPSSVVRGGPEGPYANFSGPSTVTILDRAAVPSDAIWSATLTPQDIGSPNRGCDNTITGDECHSTSVLTDDEFDVGGTIYQMATITANSSGSYLGVDFTSDVRTVLDGYTFCVGDRGFPFSDASHLLNSRAAWVPSPALPFTVGATYGLSVVPSGSSCSAGAAPPPNMLVWGSDGWLTLTWRAPDYISTGAIVRWRLKDADPNTAGDQPGAWTPENGVLLRSEQHDAQRATLPPWNCSNCVPLVPGKLYEVGLRLVTATGFSDWGLAGEGVPRAAWPLALSVDSGAIPHGGSVTVTARLGYPAATLMWLRFDTEGDDGAARWGPDCDWEHGATDIIGPGQTEATVKLCATAGVTMTIKARILDTDAEATPIRVRALGPNPPTAITLSADQQAVANGGPATVTARLDRPTAPGMTVRLSINGLGAAWWDHCDPPRRYRGTWGGKVIEIPPGGQEATAELCVKWRDGPPLEIAAWSDAPRLQAKTLSLLEPASLVLRSLTVSSTDPAEGLPENAVDLSDASNDYNFSVPRAVSSVTVKPAAAYETTSVKVNGQAVDAGTPAVDVPLDVGDNTIRIEVRAPAAPAVREYTLTVTRMEASTDKETQVLARPECEADTGPLCGIALSAGSESVAFSPDFTRDTTAYRATVPAGTTSVTLTPDYAEGTSVFTGSRNGSTTYTRPTRVRPSGTAVELALAPDGGATELWLMVSGSGGMTTYSIHLTGARPEPKTYSVSAASTAAEGANATLTVTLSEAAPTGGVALTVSTGYGGGSTATADDVGSIASPVTVAEGETALAITIPTVDDAVDEDDETFTVTVAATTSGWEKAGDGRDTATVTITDDDTAGVTVTPTTLSVAEDGRATYTVTLDSRPTADVTVTVTSGDDGAASVSPASYTFTPSGWNISQIFIVSGVADDDADDESVTISHSAASSDGKYNGIAVASVAVSVTDDTPEQQQQQTAEPVEIPGPVVGLLLEATTDSVTVSWQAPQSGGAPDRYIVHIKNLDTGKGKDRKVPAGKTTTTFRNLKAGATYRVWVRAQNEGGKGERVHARMTLPDGVVQGGEGDPPPEQQAAGTFSVSATASAAEGGNAALTITLSEAAPTGGAAFTVTAGYVGQTATAADVGSITSPVTVAAGNDTLQLAIPTVDDDVDEDDETFTVTVAATTSGWEKEGDGRDTATVTITDDDTAGVTVTPTTLNVSEDGSASYTVVLDSKPTADVTVTPTGSDGGAASVSPASHTFTPSDWNTPQTFTVSGVADEDRDDDSVIISNSATGGDGKYGGISVDDVSVSVTDTTPPPAQEPASASCPEETEPPVPGQKEPFNVCVTPGDGTLTVTWTVAPRDGFEDGEIRHALRWSQEPGVWANPTDPNAVGPNDGISVEGGVYTYTITGLQNGVATGVFVRSFTGGNYNEDSPESSKWVRIKGENTTPRAATTG